MERISIDFFKQAIARDPDYPLPHVGLADSYAMLAVFGVLAPKDAFPPALAAATKALELDSELGEAHASLAHIKIQYERDFQTAEHEYQRALSIAPRYAVAHMWYGLLIAWTGDFDRALATMRHAQQLEPLQLGTSANIALAGRKQEALAELDRLMKLSRERYVSAYDIAAVHVSLGNDDQAFEWLERAIEERAMTLVLLPYDPAFDNIRADLRMKNIAQRSAAPVSREAHQKK